MKSARCLSPLADYSPRRCFNYTGALSASCTSSLRFVQPFSPTMNLQPPPPSLSASFLLLCLLCLVWMETEETHAHAHARIILRRAPRDLQDDQTKTLRNQYPCGENCRRKPVVRRGSGVRGARIPRRHRYQEILAGDVCQTPPVSGPPREFSIKAPPPPPLSLTPLLLEQLSVSFFFTLFRENNSFLDFQIIFLVLYFLVLYYRGDLTRRTLQYIRSLGNMTYTNIF